MSPRNALGETVDELVDLRTVKGPRHGHEACYRTAYRDGFIAAINFFFGSMSGKRADYLGRMAFRFWERQLLDWRNGKGYLPPRLKCAHCGSEKELEIDHIVPQSWGGDSELSNLQLLCRSHNASKSNKFEG